MSTSPSSLSPTVISLVIFLNFIHLFQELVEFLFHTRLLLVLSDIDDTIYRLDQIIHPQLVAKLQTYAGDCVF